MNSYSSAELDETLYEWIRARNPKNTEEVRALKDIYTAYVHDAFQDYIDTRFDGEML